LFDGRQDVRDVGHYILPVQLGTQISSSSDPQESE
jgi:hypothetical protein